MKYVVLSSLPIAALMIFIVGSSSQPPPGKGDKKDGPPGGPPRFQLGKLFPPHLREELMLTKEQEKQLADLELEVKGKLEKILTADQKKMIEDHRPPKKEDKKKDEARNDDDHGRPVAQIAKDLGVTPEQFREAFKKVRPAPAGEEPTPEQRRRNRQVLSEALGVSPERLDQVMDKYRPGGKGTNGQDRPR